MAISVDWINKIVNSTSDILDLPAFKDTIRDLEDDALGMLYAPIITYKRIDLGGGAYFHAVDFINGYRLKFPNAGNYTIEGNLNADIVPVAGVFIERKTSAAFATSSTSVGSGGLTTDQATQLLKIYQSLMFDPTAPVITSANKIEFSDVVINLTGNPDVEITGTRE